MLRNFRTNCGFAERAVAQDQRQWRKRAVATRADNSHQFPADNGRGAFGGLMQLAALAALEPLVVNCRISFARFSVFAISCLRGKVSRGYRFCSNLDDSFSFLR